MPRSGTVPPGWLAPASALVNLQLDSNSFNGSLPAELPPSLQFLYLLNNNFAGSIPSWDLPNLVEASLITNQLTGGWCSVAPRSMAEACCCGGGTVLRCLAALRCAAPALPARTCEAECRTHPASVCQARPPGSALVQSSSAPPLAAHAGSLPSWGTSNSTRVLVLPQRTTQSFCGPVRRPGGLPALACGLSAGRGGPSTQPAATLETAPKSTSPWAAQLGCRPSQPACPVPSSQPSSPHSIIHIQVPATPPYYQFIPGASNSWVPVNANELPNCTATTPSPPASPAPLPPPEGAPRPCLDKASECAAHRMRCI